MKKQLLTLTLGLMTLGAIAQKSEIKIAEKAIKKNNFSGAITALSAAEALMGDMDAKSKAKFYFLKGKAFAGTKDYEKAADAFNNLIKLEKSTGRAKYTKQAEPMLGQMITDVSKKAIKLYNEDKDFSNAAKNFYLTYKLSPRDTSFAFNAAVAATQAKDYDTALSYYRELKNVGYTGIFAKYTAIDKATNEKVTFPNKVLRDASVKSGSHIKPEIIASKSKKSEIIKNIALILKDQGKTDEAILAVKEARKANPGDLNLLLNEADLYIKLERMDKFEELMKEAVKIDPNNPTLFFNLGVVNFNQKKVKEAKGFYKKALELKPNYYDALLNFAVAILDEEKSIVEEMNKNLSNFSKYDELEKKQKVVYQQALPFLEKADGIKRTLETVKTLSNIYSILEMEDKAKEYGDLYREMR